MRITLVLKSGVEFEVNCSSFKLIRNGQGKVIGIDVAKIVQKAPY